MDFLTGSVRIARVAGINVRVHMLYLLWMAFQLIQARAGWKVELLFLGMLFVIILLHEFGHCFGARAVGGDAREILMWPLGGLAFAGAPMRAWPQFVTVACGPLVNVLFCVVSGVLLLATGTSELVLRLGFIPTIEYFGRSEIYGYIELIYTINLWLLVFNLLPIFPMDGGQLLRTILWPGFGLRQATIIATTVGLFGAAVLLGWGLGLFGGRASPMLIMIAIFGGLISYQQRAAAIHWHMSEDAPVQSVRWSERRRGFWSRLFGSGGGRARPVSPPAPSENPNPGGWEARIEEEQRVEVEVDRILKKVKEQGIHSLSYIERQTLERATRERQERERAYDRGDA
jgi:Zn-dependent protease